MRHSPKPPAGPGSSRGGRQRTGAGGAVQQHGAVERNERGVHARIAKAQRRGRVAQQPRLRSHQAICTCCVQVAKMLAALCMQGGLCMQSTLDSNSAGEQSENTRDRRVMARAP